MDKHCVISKNIRKLRADAKAVDLYKSNIANRKAVYSNYRMEYL